jgi:prepilin-type N-terminal cleavage/methylation domain-containing protein
MIMKRFAIVNAGRTSKAFTLIELLISLAVTALIILMVAQLMSSATAVTRTGNKHIDTVTQARVVFDRMAVDFAKMLKRTDIDYYIKAPSGYKNPKSHGKANHLTKGQQGNDQIAFFSQVPGYYPSTSSQSPLSLVAYRINQNTTAGNPSYLMLERMGKGLLWNGASNGTTSTSPYPIVFTTGQIDGTCTNKCPCAGTTGPWAGPWSAAICTDNTDPAPSSYETIGPGVFRLEYYFLLKDGTVTDVPAESWDSTKTVGANLNAFSDVQAIGVAIAVIDPANRSLLSQQQLLNIMSDLPDFATAHGNGYGNPAKTISFLETVWEGVLESIAQTGTTSDGSAFPPAAASAVRIYNRYFDMRTPAGF